MADKILTLTNLIEGVLTDLDSEPTFQDETNTYGVRRADTLAVHTDPGTPWVRASEGTYTATLTSLVAGVEYDYVVRSVYNGAVDYSPSDFTAEADAEHYATEADVEKELFGAGNLAVHSDSDKDLLGDSEQVTFALGQADVRANLKLGAYSPPPSAFPVTSTQAWVTTAVRTAATKYAAGYLLNQSQKQMNLASAQGVQTDGDRKIAEGDELLQMLIDAGLPGVTLDDEDETPAAGTFSFVPINRDACDGTSDENTRPLLWY